MIEYVIGRGSMVMASDFALKALIKIWPDDAGSSMLGPPPFCRVMGAQIDSQFTLKFDPKVLAACASAQLNKVRWAYLIKILIASTGTLRQVPASLNTPPMMGCDVQVGELCENGEANCVHTASNNPARVIILVPTL